MAEPVETQLIGFRTDGRWTAQDVTVFFDSIATIYDALQSSGIANSIRSESLRESRSRLRDFAKRYRKRMRHPFVEEFWYDYVEMIEDWPLDEELPPPPFFPGLPFGHIQPQANVPNASMVFADLGDYRNDDECLVVHRIRMASPGGFSLQGIGEIVKELRELIKDVWFRNAQERTLGELEIIEKSLAIQHKYQNENVPKPKITIDNRKLSKTIRKANRSYQRVGIRGQTIGRP